MTPQLSADLHAAGLITTIEALWVYGDQGMIVPNSVSMIKDGEPVF